MKKIHIVRHIILFVHFLLLICFPYGQTSSDKASWLQVYHKAEALYTSADANDKTDSLALGLYSQLITAIHNNHWNDVLLADAYLKAGIISMGHNKTMEALDFFSDAIQLKKRNPSVPDSLFFKPNLYSGSIYYDLNNLDSASLFYKKAENILKQFPGILESERLYNKLGALYYETGDYRKSIPYFTRALSEVEKKPSENIYLIVNYRNNIASALRKLGYTDSAISIYRELLPLHINEDELFHNIGVALLDENKNAEALEYLKKAAYHNQALYNHLAQAFTRLQQIKMAKIYIDSSFLAYQKKGSPPHDFDYANTLQLAGDISIAENKIPAAIRFYQQSIIQLKPDFTDTSIYNNPESFRSLGNSFALFDVLIAKAKAFVLLDNSRIMPALNAYDAALSLARQTELRYHSDEARLFLNSKVTPACRAAVDIGIDYIKKTGDQSLTGKIFRWSEANKAAVLQAGLYSLQLDSISSLPKTLLNQIKNSKALLAKLTLRASLANNTPNRDVLEKKIVDLEIMLAGMQDKLEEYPGYSQLEFASHETSLDSIQKNITADDEAIISYYYTTKSLLLFFITKDEKGVLNTPLPAGLFVQIDQYRHELNAGESADKQAIEKLSVSLFDELVNPVFDKIKLKKRIIIIPYNEISFVPFESLINPSDRKFLMEDFSMSYDYSANFLRTVTSHVTAGSGVLAFAPFTTNRNEQASLPSLPASRSEVEMLKGRVFYDQEATKSQFNALCGSFPVIHLATHAKANDIDPFQSYIEFYGNRDDADTVHRLYEREIYHLDMKNTRLVVLSACETGSGQLVNGEGIMSLARAFSYAGCPSVITSLWKANDQATSFISRRFHNYLADGKPIDKALQQAKKDYLENADIPARYKSPAYWAHLVLIGDYQPVYKAGVSLIGVAVSIFFVGLIILLIMNKIKKRAQ